MSLLCLSLCVRVFAYLCMHTFRHACVGLCFAIYICHILCIRLYNYISLLDNNRPGRYVYVHHAELLNTASACNASAVSSLLSSPPSSSTSLAAAGTRSRAMLHSRTTLLRASDSLQPCYTGQTGKSPRQTATTAFTRRS